MTDLELLDLLDLLERRPGWQLDALCREYPDRSWFLRPGDDAADRVAICQRCMVMTECRSFAIAEGMEHGIWGGLTPRQIRNARNDASSAA